MGHECHLVSYRGLNVVPKARPLFWVRKLGPRGWLPRAREEIAAQTTKFTLGMETPTRQLWFRGESSGAVPGVDPHPGSLENLRMGQRFSGGSRHWLSHPPRRVVPSPVGQSGFPETLRERGPGGAGRPDRPVPSPGRRHHQGPEEQTRRLAGG